MRICKVEGCGEKHFCKGYCSKHYHQYKKYGENLAPTKPTICSVDDCEEQHYCLGYCIKHYRQYKKYGHILDRTKNDLNEIIEYEDYAEVIIYNKQCEEIARALIDLDDVEKIKNYKWYMRKDYIINDTVGYMHRFITNCSPDKVVDHINNNPLDNRKANLRICTQTENLMNRKKQKTNTSSIYKGVSWKKPNNKWSVQIRVNKKLKYIGYYDDELEASIAYDKASIMYYKEFAKTNHPIENYTDYIISLGLEPKDFGIDESNH